MNQLKKLTSLVMLTGISSSVLSHEGLHAAGQLNLMGGHLSMMEISIAVIAVVACYAWSRKQKH